jgi:DNA gyrase/topoisomerase IV subunit A
MEKRSMLDKKDARWWILEAEQHPESAIDLIRMLAERLALLDRQNEELRGEVIALRRRLRGDSAAPAPDVAALQKRVEELEAALRQGTVQQRLVIYASDRIEVNQPYEETLGSVQVLPGDVKLLRCATAASLLIVTGDSRVFSLSLADLPAPEPGRGAAMLGNPRDVAAIIDQGIFERCRFLTLLTQNGYAYSVLVGRIMTAAARQEKLIRNLIPGDPVIAAVPSYNGDLFAVSRRGRWTRFPERTIAGGGSLVMELPKGDALAGIVSLNGEADLAFLTEEGRLLVRPSADFAARKAPGASAGQPFRGHTICGVGGGQEALILTRQGALLSLRLDTISAAAYAEAGIRLPGLRSEDSVLTYALT